MNIFEAENRLSLLIKAAQAGEDVVIASSVSNDAAKDIFGSWEAPLPYLRIVPQPS